MNREEFFEEGIVSEVSDGIAVVTIDSFYVKKERCKICPAKVYCRLNEKNENLLMVKDKSGTIPGDKVRVCLRSEDHSKTFFFFYFIPLIIFITGFLTGLILFDLNQEIYSFLLALGLAGIYSMILSLISRRKDFKLIELPEITLVYHS